ERAQAVLDSLYQADTTCVGILVHVEAPGLSWSGASGRSLKGGAALDPAAPILIASNTKTYVAATVLRLVEGGKLSLDQPIGPLISERSRELFAGDGYDLEAITLTHLLSHTSGIDSYTNYGYIDSISAQPMHRWTRDEQLARTVRVGTKLAEPGVHYAYTDANYLLLTEVIEGRTGMSFPAAMRKLLRYDAMGYDHTWMPTLEPTPADALPLAHQYWDELGWDSYGVEVSADLYGGGGIACTTSDAARFMRDLLTGRIVQDKDVLQLIYTEVPTQDSVPSNYLLGLQRQPLDDLTTFGHGGFWRSHTLYLPALDAAISVAVLERKHLATKNRAVWRLVTMLRK
ncbi:MAG: serine hydrolase domain-containing protein, partial [Flavobacteriales bacterium]